MNKLYTTLFFALALTSPALKAQVADSMQTNGNLKEVTVTGYISKLPLLKSPASLNVLNARQIQLQAEESLLPALNALPGVRMEERSPGSYRLSLRGSLLRSPFGVRNVKVYIDDFPLTDAGGNTYLNLIDTRSIERLEILKGPDGSLFGANSGGVVLIDATGQLVEDKKLSLGVNSGSYGLFHENIALQKQSGNSQFSLHQAFQRSDGYRENSALRRHYLQASERWQYNSRNQLKLFAFFADLRYQTPGGLTLNQFNENPRQARPAGGPNPGAVEQQARIENQTWFGGISHESNITDKLRHVIAVFGSHTNYRNPFITNYEIRDEANYGARTYLELSGDASAAINWKWNLGLEYQSADQEIRNYTNTRGIKGDIQAADALEAKQHFYFTRFSADIYYKLTAEAAVSLNYYQYDFRGLIIAPDALKGKRKFSPAWMPRLGLAYAVHPNLAWRASVSRGYSPPTIAEIRPSNTIINAALEAENGLNYETGFRYSSSNNRFQVDASVFNFRLREAIARRVDASDAEYFVNAGGTNQLGVESLISAWLIQPREAGFIRGLQWTNSYTYSHFRFSNYNNAENDYSGNNLTGVPQHVVVSGLVLNLPASLILSSQYNYTDRIPLNDANSAFADSYHLVQAKIRWQTLQNEKHRLEFFAGADNILNQKYSLGNDINAFGNRYFNAAPLRNYYAGLTFTLL